MVTPIILQVGADIPFYSAGVAIHQPTIKEISYIGGEEILYTACEVFKFSKNNLSDKDKIDLSKKTDFDIIMSTLTSNNREVLKNVLSVQSLLLLLFPDYSIYFDNRGIKLVKDELISYIDNSNFLEFKEIISEMFNLKKNKQDDYNPGNKLAEEIANKLRARKKKLAELKGSNDKNKKIDIFGRYISILAVGLNKDKNTLSNYTVFQILDEFERFQLKQEHDLMISAKLAGSTSKDEIKDWLIDMYS